MTLRLFVRQSFTQAQEAEQAQIQGVLDTLLAMRKEHPHVLVTGTQAQNAHTFRSQFERDTSQPFSPRAFRDERLRLLRNADAMIIIRTGLSESSAFEIAYNIYSGLRLPMFFAVARNAPIKTTLLQDLNDICQVQYHTFLNAEELGPPLARFLASFNVGVS